VTDLWPRFDAFPRLAEVPHVTLRTAPTPVEQVGERLWIKRDDLTAEPIGGNKVRALEFLLAQFPRGSRVITGGSRGSTHVLSTILHARNLGIEIEAASWPQEMNDVARTVDARIERETTRRHFRHPVTAAAWLTWKAWRGEHVIPAGGTTPRGMLGHVYAAFELAEQVRAGLLPRPDRIVVPLGTGGTAVGLAMGLALCMGPRMVVGARVVPWIIARESRLRRLTVSLAREIHRVTGNWPGVRDEADVVVAEGVYGGAYGRPLAGAPHATPNGVSLDPTYSAKAFVAANQWARERNTLFWMTFDSRWMHA
jgi:1-aminocyclopropane-1-carboxylate deaminase/D-cysteine desulfhydrase-like pyridoxal-dependent ACC family enzyme